MTAKEPTNIRTATGKKSALKTTSTGAGYRLQPTYSVHVFLVTENVEMSWEKNGSCLSNDTTNSSAGMNFSEAGSYCGRYSLVCKPFKPPFGLRTDENVSIYQHKST